MGTEDNISYKGVSSPSEKEVRYAIGPTISNFSKELHSVSRRNACAALVLFIIATSLVYGCYLQPPRWDKNFGISDNRHFFGPNTYYLDASLKNGEYPLWNPLAYCGLPFSADPQTNACYPFHLLRSVLTPGFNPYASAAGKQILMVLHVLWAGLGAFFLAQSYGLSFGASMVCGLAFMFNPYSITCYTDYYVFALTIPWTPWILWAVRGALWARNNVRRVWFFSWSVIFFSMSTLGGFPQLSLYIAVMLSLFVIFDGVVHISWGYGFKSLRDVMGVFFSRWVFLAILAVCVGVASAVVLLPELQLGLFSGRSIAGGLKMPNWSQNREVLHLLKSLVVYPGNTWEVKGCRAAGIGSLMMIIVALSHTRRRDVLIFLALYLLMLDCTLGPPFPLAWLLRKIDVMNITSSPWRAGDFAILALSMVAGFGVDAAGKMPRLFWWRVIRTVLVISASGAMFFLLWHWITHAPLFQPSALVWFLPALTVSVLCLFAWWNAPRFGRIIMAILVGGEIMVWSIQMLPHSIERIKVANNADTAQFGQARHLTRSNFRKAHIRPNRQMWLLDHAMNGYNPLFLGSTSQVLCSPGDEKTYLSSWHLKFKAVTENNLRGTLLAKRCFWLTRQWVSGNLPPKNEAFPPTTTAFLPDVPMGATLPVPEINRDQLSKSPVSNENTRVDLGAPDVLNKSITKSGGNMKLQFSKLDQRFVHAALYIGYKAAGKIDISASCVDETGARYTLKTNQTKKTEDGERLFYVPLPDCDSSTVTLTWPGNSEQDFQLTEAYVLKDSSDEDSHIVIDDRTPNSVRVTLKDLPDARILTFLDSYYPGWYAWVDGEEVEIMRADDAFKAIAVPAGTHQVFFKFESVAAYIGLVLSIIAYAILGAVLIVTFFRKRTYE
ncbi:MAG TPA: YfhO family protein [Candidatus Hydrogenedentes bacterium]|nr:YfhO family protein [Candidatus Hydrogenedentota bacterium]